MPTSRILSQVALNIRVAVALLAICILLMGVMDTAKASADFPPECAPLGPYACSSMQATPFRYTWQPNCTGPATSPTEAAAVAALTEFDTGPNTCSYTIAPAIPWLSGSNVTIYGCAVIVYNGQLPQIDAATGFETYNARTYNTRHNFRMSAGQACDQTGEGTPWLIRHRDQYCPPGMGYAYHNGKRYCRGDALAKALGEPQQCSAVGNPVHSATGNKYQRESDYAGASDPLVFERHYNSITYAAYASDQFTAIGKLWRHTYDRWIEESATNSLTTANVYRGDGKVFAFNLYNGVYYGDRDVQSKLSRLYDNGTPVGWKYLEQTDDSEETYNNEGRLTGIKFRSGVTLSLTYDSGRLSTIVDSFGRQISLSYDSMGRIDSMTDPAGGQYLYEYAVNGDLIKVTYPDGRDREYLYRATGTPHALIGIIDENESRYATYDYVNGNVAILSEHAGGVGRVTLAFNPYNPLTVITDALGTSRQHWFARIAGIPRKVAVSQPCTNCGSANSTGYDANGNISSVVDFKGNRTCYEYDLARNLETARVEGFAPGSACPASLGSYVPAAGTRQRKISAQWHSTYRLPVQIDEPGKRTVFTHDASGNVLTRTILDTSSSESRTWSYAYNSFGKVISSDGPRTDVSDVTTYSYYTCNTGYQCGQIQTITNALGHTTTYNTYNAHGQPLTITDANGVVTTLAYDPRRRLISRTVGGEQTSFEYWPTGLVKKATLPDASYLEYTYDAAHRLTDINDAEGHRVHYTLDAMGNRTAEQAYDPSNVLTRTRTRVFDTLNRLQKEVGAAGTANVTTTFGYDNNGNQTSIAAPLGRDTTQAYDELNRLKQVTDPLNGVTQYGYNARDQLISVTDPRGLITSYSYNALGDLKQQTSPDTGITTNTYDSGGNLATTTDARNAVATYTYDALSRVATAAFASGSTIDQTLTYTYDTGAYGKGRLTGVSDADHSLSWTYDDQGRVLTATQAVGSIGKTTSYTYANGLRQSMTTPSGQVITYGYTNGKITSISVNGTVVVSGILYDPFGPVRQWTWADSSLAVRTFDQDGNIALLDSAGLKTYSYDDAFRITGIADTTNSALSWTYGYDDLDRLTSASKTGTTLGYTYDANGNRLTETGSNPSTFTIAANSNRLSSASGALSRTYGYDNAGNTTSFTGVSFTYNNRGRMSSSTKNGVTTSYTYNALGQLVKKTGSTLYYYDEAGHILGIYDGSGALTEEIVWLGDTPVATLRPKSGGGVHVYNIHTDHLDTPRMITDAVGAVVRWRWDGEPFGGGAVNDDPTGAGVFEFNLRFPGQVAMSETGLHYNYFRDYDPTMGRYAQSDPVGLKGGVNTYAYALGNPLRYVDSRGLMSEIDARLWAHYHFGDGSYMDISSACATYLGDAVISQEVSRIRGEAELRAHELISGMGENQTVSFSLSNRSRLVVGSIFGNDIYSFGQGFHEQAAECTLSKGCGKCGTLTCGIGVAARDRFSDPYDLNSDFLGTPFWFGLKCKAGSFSKQVCGR